jgi:hypothetical protein
VNRVELTQFEFGEAHPAPAFCSAETAHQTSGQGKKASAVARSRVGGAKGVEREPYGDWTYFTSARAAGRYGNSFGEE